MGELLTDLEHEALKLSGQLASLMRLIIGDGPMAHFDWNEAASRIHMILAQAAARAYPDRYRAMGRSLTESIEDEGVLDPPPAGQDMSLAPSSSIDSPVSS